MPQRNVQSWPPGTHHQILPERLKAPSESQFTSPWFNQEPAVARLSQEDIVKRVSALEIETKELQAFFKLSSVFINTLGSSQWDIKKPLSIAIEQRSDSEFIACLYDIDLYGYGETIPEALKDLRLSIVNQFEFLLSVESEDVLSEPLKKQFGFLKSILSKKNV